MKTFRELYSENEGVKENGRYVSHPYNIAQFDTDQSENLEKAYYLKNDIEKRDKLREILSEKTATAYKHLDREDFNNWKLYFEDFKDFSEYAENERLIYGGYFWESYKREIEIICYLNELAAKADKMAQSNEYNAICYLIEQKYFYHTGILDEPQNNFVFRGELNQIIFDYLQLKINELSHTAEPQTIAEPPKYNKKPLKWNAKKQSLGTLFGLLVEHKIITGSKTDLERVLAGIFDNISPSTIKDNLNFKTNENEGKNYYCTDTPEYLAEWLEYLQNSTTKQK